VLVINAAFCPSCGSPQLNYNATAYIAGYNLLDGRIVLSYDISYVPVSCSGCGAVFSQPYEGRIVLLPDAPNRVHAFVIDDIFSPSMCEVYELVCTRTGGNVAVFHNPKRLARLDMNEIVDQLYSALTAAQDDVALSAYETLISMATGYVIPSKG
jgi:hypothetical protein